MSYVVAVDPGLHGCGVAIFEHELGLIRAQYRQSFFMPSRPGKLYQRIEGACAGVLDLLATGFSDIGQLVTECPLVYPNSPREKQVEPNHDLVPLAQIGARLGGLLRCGWTQYYPYEWKGTVKKVVFTQRILGRLNDTELQCIERGPLDHNTIDAVGIGLHYLGRLHPLKRYPRA